MLHRPATVVIALALGILVSLAGAPASAQVAAPFFMTQNGGMYHYVRQSDTRFSSIADNIEQGWYAQRGIRNLIIYCPYQATDEWRGVPAVDFFSVNANTGTVEDFGAMVNVAHAHGMRVSMYIGLLFVDFDNAVWKKAELDRAAGVASPEAATFRWAQSGGGAAAPFGDWAYSSVAGAYYARSWNHPAIDFGSQAGRDYATKVLAFWLDLGVDGFEYDCPPGIWGQNSAILKSLLVTLPNTRTPGAKYLIGEGGYASYDNAAANDAVGFTHVLLNGDDDSRSVATDVMNGSLSLDGLEDHFVLTLDKRRAAGRGSKAVSTYISMSAEERALEAALLAGNGALMEIDHEENYSQLDAAQQAAYDAVFAALDRSEAEAPGAARLRLPTGKPDVHFAVLRTAENGVKALNVYNFERASSTVVVSLASTGIRDGDVPTDLSTQKQAAPASAGSFTIALPALGYAFLRFGNEPMPEAGSDGVAPVVRDATVVVKDARSGGDAQRESAAPTGQGSPTGQAPSLDEPDDVQPAEPAGGCACRAAATLDARAPWALLLGVSALVARRRGRDPV
jgi:hypothetical protein